MLIMWMHCETIKKIVCMLKKSCNFAAKLSCYNLIKHAGGCTVNAEPPVPLNFETPEARLTISHSSGRVLESRV